MGCGDEVPHTFFKFNTTWSRMLELHAAGALTLATEKDPQTQVIRSQEETYIHYKCDDGEHLHKATARN
jgi:hypothetical protein